MVGNECIIGRFSYGYRIGWYQPNRISAIGDNAVVSIGNRCTLNGVNIFARNKVEIGNNVVIASGSQITDTNGHLTYSLDRTKSADTPKPVKIGNNVWIGLNAIILKGTEIGDNSIVGAGSVVQGIFPPNCIIKGNPAVVVKTLDIK